MLQLRVELQRDVSCSCSVKVPDSGHAMNVWVQKQLKDTDDS